MQKTIQSFQKFILKYYIPVLVISFLAINVIFNSKIVSEIIHNSVNRTYGEDTVLLHYFAESAYQKILHFQNPFHFNSDILYPFGSATVLGETGIIHSFYFLFLRPFLHPYAALLAVVFINLFLGQLSMYGLLRHLKVGKFLSFLFANVYALAPFVSVRIQYHYNYVYHFLFALITLLILLILNTSEKLKKFVYSVLLGVSAGLLFYNTLYYVVIYLLFIFFFCFFYILFNRKTVKGTVIQLRSSLLYFVTALIVFFIILSPFLVELFQVLKVSEIKQTQGWGGAIEFSANALDLFIPSEFNPFLGAKLKNIIPEKQHIEQVIYPGVLVLLGIVGFIFWNRKKKWESLVFVFFTFYILSLGPFLHIYKYWNIRITDTILGVIPLPYIILKKLPILSMMRAPVRFSVMISFTGVLISALFFQQFLKRYSVAKNIIYPLFLLIFFVDQFYIPKVQPQEIKTPSKSYAIINQDKSDVVVMEIPYVIQDGFYYWGKVFHAFPMVGQLIHRKQIIGGYLARVDDSKFNYYTNDPLLSYFGFVADTNRQEQNYIFKKSSYQEMGESADFLSIKYILVREDLPLFKIVDRDLTLIEFKKSITHDDGMSLYVRNPQLKESKTINLHEAFSRNLYGNWSTPKNTHRWIDGKTAGVFFKSVDAKPVTIKFNSVSYQTSRKMRIYINKKLAKEVEVSLVPQPFTITSNEVKKGLNTIDIVTETIQTKKIPGQDPRNLSVAFSDFVIQ